MSDSNQIGSREGDPLAFLGDDDSETDARGDSRVSELIEIAITAFRIAWSDWRTRIGFAILLLYLLMGTVGVVLIEPPTHTISDGYIKPFTTLEYPLGTDRFGQGLLALTVHATPSMLKMIAAGALFATIIATIVGAIAGYEGGTTDRVLMGLSDIVIALPGLPLIMVLAAIYSPRNPYIIGIILTVNAWAGLARSIRSEVLTVKEDGYVKASMIMGIPSWKIIANDILPNLMPYVMISFVRNGRTVIVGSVALYFLGVLPVSNLNWGVTMNVAYKESTALYNLDVAHWLLVPLVAIILLSLGLVLIAQGADRLFNPRVRARQDDADASNPR